MPSPSFDPMSFFGQQGGGLGGIFNGSQSGGTQPNGGQIGSGGGLQGMLGNLLQQGGQGGQGQGGILDLIHRLFPGVGGGGTPQTGGPAQPPSTVPQQTPQQQFPAFRSGSPMPGILQRFGQQWPQLRQPVQPMANNPPPTGAPYHN